jgi:hypothetical protein
VVRQFLNARRQGPIGMAEEKDAAELEAEREEGDVMPALPPIPPQIEPSNGSVRPTQRPAGQWLNEHKITPPPGSFTGEGSYANSATSTAPPATTEKPRARVSVSGDRSESSVRVLRGSAASRRKSTTSGTQSKAAPAKKTGAAKKASAAKKTTRGTGSTRGRNS